MAAEKAMNKIMVLLEIFMRADKKLLNFRQLRKYKDLDLNRRNINEKQPLIE